MREVAIIPVHQFGLAEVDRLDAAIDIRHRQEVEPELCLGAAHIRYGVAGPPVILAATVRMADVSA